MEKNLLENLNKEQKEAVTYTNGPLLILAGAGSGKTRVLVHRIAYLIGHEGVAPHEIMAITFTNKAAGEMRTRVDEMIGFGSRQIWVSTFHSSCVRILREHIERLGYNRHFSIYDTDDQLKLMKEVAKRLEIDTKRFKEKNILGQISRAKDELIDPVEYARNAGDEYEDVVARAYDEYQKSLAANNALDFDDLIMMTVRLFKECPDVLKLYQQRFRYIMVDEYQDTNTAQFKYVSALAAGHHNLCVVGDDDQSIYKFRGANINNILNFEKIFPETKTIRLEQNYRSTQNILNCANNVIKNNKGRKPKTLWTGNEEGIRPRFIVFENGFREAEFVSSDIEKAMRKGGCEYRDFAVLYRTNAQSRILEEKFLMASIPYRIVGGINFYSRMEIKDILAYLKTIDNGEDAIAVKRIINVPKRGIGAASLAKIDMLADSLGVSFFDALLESSAVLSERTCGNIRRFTDLIMSLREKAETKSPSELIDCVLGESGYMAELEEDMGEEEAARIENINELISKAVQYEKEAEEPSLSGFLEEVALIADIDSVNESDDQVLLMTLHSSKGLEFPYVYITGMEDGVLPGYLALESGDMTEVEEERRLTYVGITRAKRTLTFTAAAQRMARGNVEYNPVSRFIKEIPEELLDMKEERGSFFDDGGYGFGRGRTSAVSFGRGGSSSGSRKKSGIGGSFGRGNPYSQKKQFTVSSGETLDFGVGDRVRHAKFGEGLVTDITHGGRDYEVTVDFDSGETKKMFASFANLKRV